MIGNCSLRDDLSMACPLSEKNCGCRPAPDSDGCCPGWTNIPCTGSDGGCCAGMQPASGCWGRVCPCTCLTSWFTISLRSLTSCDSWRVLAHLGWWWLSWSLLPGLLGVHSSSATGIWRLSLLLVSFTLGVLSPELSPGLPSFSQSLQLLCLLFVQALHMFVYVFFSFRHEFLMLSAFLWAGFGVYVVNLLLQLFQLLLGAFYH